MLVVLRRIDPARMSFKLGFSSSSTSIELSLNELFSDKYEAFSTKTGLIGSLVYTLFQNHSGTFLKCLLLLTGTLLLSAVSIKSSFYLLSDSDNQDQSDI